MKIVFICGSLEIGRDGVGDYIRRLAGELIFQGHQITCLALYDWFVKVTTREDQFCDKQLLPVLRIPGSISSGERYALAKNFIYFSNPELISLQFVPYSFDKKGLPFKLNKHLRDLGINVKWHIMFHELWLMNAKYTSLKSIIIGFIQKRLIINLIKNLRPSTLHTQSKYYQYQLNLLGFEVYHLPLFSNIPVSINDSLYKCYSNLGDKKIISLVVFGTIHSGAAIKDFANEAAVYAKIKGVKIFLYLLGRCGSEQENWLNAWKGANLEYKVLGEESAEQISEVLYMSSIGLTSNPMIFVEKSGTVAALLEHGLPVICINQPLPTLKKEKIKTPSNVYEYCPGNIGFYFSLEKNQVKRNVIREVSWLFIRDLEKG